MKSIHERVSSVDMENVANIEVIKHAVGQGEGEFDRSIEENETGPTQPEGQGALPLAEELHQPPLFQGCSLLLSPGHTWPEGQKSDGPVLYARNLCRIHSKPKSKRCTYIHVYVYVYSLSTLYCIPINCTQ